MKYIKTYENIIDGPQVGDYIYIFSNTRFYYPGKIIEIENIDNEIVYLVDFETHFLKKSLSEDFNSIYFDQIRLWAKSIEELNKKEEEWEKYLKNLARKIQYNLNNFFEIKKLVKKLWPKDFNVKDLKFYSVKCKYIFPFDRDAVILIDFENSGLIEQYAKTKLEVYLEKLKEMGLYKEESRWTSEFGYYERKIFNKEDAEEMLKSIKTEFALRLARKEGEKYNL